MCSIKSVIPNDNYIIDIWLSNGILMKIDFSSKLQTLRFGKFADINFFKSVETDGLCLRWEDKIEISISELHQMVNKQNR